ncbi:Alpha/Beta hydrolase protein [Flagelloscypha sp. PMI_526]|nr:Alpha/Beta hydrolase protein [Flagelloscypha sp. PMI_526]
MFSTIPAALHFLVTSLLWQSPFLSNTPPSALDFELRHSHGVVANSSRVIFSNVDRSFAVASGSHRSYRLSQTTVQTHKPKSFELHVEARLRSLYHSKTTTTSALWNSVLVPAPDVTDLDTVITLAEMTSNSYTTPDKKDWYDIGPEWDNNSTFPFGWEPDENGFRGHVFVSKDNGTVVVSIKGTSVPILGGGPTVSKDKLNDNLLFSCCCARVGPTWSTVCPCYAGSGKCTQSCLEKSLVEESLFYNVATNLYNNLTYLYPEANIWVIGHSLGGALASLTGVTFGVPVVAFEAPGEQMAARRLHLPSPPSLQHVTHVYNTGDPIAMGVCTGVASSCAMAGYAMESKCHLGKSIVLDTISVLGWSSNVQNHPIVAVIDGALNVTDVDWGYGTRPFPGNDNPGETVTSWAGWWPWPGKKEEKEPQQPILPPAEEVKDCVDCYAWEFGEF